MRWPRATCVGKGSIEVSTPARSSIAWAASRIQLSRNRPATRDGLSVALLTGDTTLTVDQAWEHVKALLPATDRDTQRKT